MNIRRIVIFAGLLTAIFGGLLWAAPAGEGWVEVSSSPKLSVYCRPKPGSPIKEYQATGVIAAPNWVVENVLADAESYPSFMPYVDECHILKRGPDGWVSYQRVSAPLISGRDYVLRIRAEEHPSNRGTVYARRWQVDSSVAVPERKGVVRVKINEGSWILEPSGESTTRATYSVFTDPGGAIPATILNYANQSAIPKVFAAVEKQAAEKRYWVKR